MPPVPSSTTCCRAWSMTSRGCSLHGTNGRCRVGCATHSSRRSASTAAAAAAWATRPGWWNASTPSLARLSDDVAVGPRQLLCGRAQRPSVELPVAGEASLAGGALDGAAVRRVRAVPYDPRPRPPRHLLLRDCDGEHFRNVCLPAALPIAQCRHRCVRRSKPGLHFPLVDPREEQVRDRDGPVRPGGVARRR
eukprot:4861628-Pleurochrysis_carterae.AAC.3